jgi:hypothetical protein
VKTGPRYAPEITLLDAGMQKWSLFFLKKSVCFQLGLAVYWSDQLI